MVHVGGLLDWRTQFTRVWGSRAMRGESARTRGGAVGYGIVRCCLSTVRASNTLENGRDAKGTCGIRVLDFGRFIAAPYCGMMLADMGAEVIRADRPGGEEDRSLGLRAANGEKMTFPNYARNKKGITLNVFSKDGVREVLADLVGVSDVFLHNFSPGALKAFGLTYDDIRALKPDIIFAGVSCYGATGPYATRTGFDQIAQVFSGAASVTGFGENPPTRSAVPWVDYSTGLMTTIGILLALRHRDATGEGQSVDCALLQTAIRFTAPMIGEAEVLGRERERIGNRAHYVGQRICMRAKMVTCISRC
jgi:crotonobetainyl-CoA:carnitine CoA-transferase CaiB-like acyl-CoA transferase